MSVAETLKQAQSAGVAHAEFWRFISYSAATAVLLKQALFGQANWPVVALFLGYLAVVGGSSTAIKLFSMMRGVKNANGGS